MVGIKHNLGVSVVAAYVYEVERLLELERTRIVNGLCSNVVGLLIVPCGIMTVRICACTFGVGRDIVGVLKPPSVGEIGASTGADGQPSWSVHQ